MSLATSLRYENTSQNKNLLKALERQKDRIKMDELFAERERQTRVETELCLKSEWNESLEQAAEKQRIKTNNECIKAELKLAAKASTAVRQAALRQKLSDEKQQYEQELQRQGKAFYIQRT